MPTISACEPGAWNTGRGGRRPYPGNHSCQSEPSWPRAKTSIRPGPQDTAAGGPLISPGPTMTQVLQPPAEESQLLCHSRLSLPRSNTSRRPEPHDATAGAPEKLTLAGCPRFSGADHEPATVESYH